MESIRDIIAKVLKEPDYQDLVEGKTAELKTMATDWELKAAIKKCNDKRIELEQKIAKAEFYMMSLEYSTKTEAFKKLCSDKYAKIKEEHSQLMYQWHDLQRKKKITEGYKNNA